MPTYRVMIEGETYVVEIEDLRERPLRAVVDGEVFAVEVESESPRVSSTPSVATAAEPRSMARTQPARPPATSSAGEEITAPLPGTIVSISVAEGDSVEPGQELCVLEAMKMNNPIKSTRSGVVEEISVSVGEQVQHGTPLMTIAEA
ncbi:MAG: biotin/lipoyl-containing protein [Anaerolineae bacterium]